MRNGNQIKNKVFDGVKRVNYISAKGGGRMLSEINVRGGRSE